MSVETFSKSLQGQTFRLEVAHVGRPEVVTPSPLVGEPIQIEASVLGFAEETDVEFCIYEPFRIHEDPIETLTAKTAAETRVVAVEWTLDYEAKKDDLSGTRFVVIARCGDFANVSEPFEVLEPFEATLKDGDGKPLVGAEAILRAAGRPNIKVETDADGKITLEVPPGDYVLDLLEEEG